MRIYESTKMTLIFDRMESLERKQKKSAIRKCMSQDFKLCVWTAVSFWYFLEYDTNMAVFFSKLVSFGSPTSPLYFINTRMKHNNNQRKIL